MFHLAPSLYYPPMSLAYIPFRTSTSRTTSAPYFPQTLSNMGGGGGGANGGWGEGRRGSKPPASCVCPGSCVSWLSPIAIIKQRCVPPPIPFRTSTSCPFSPPPLIVPGSHGPVPIAFKLHTSKWREY